jgi:hypothetical protein
MLSHSKPGSQISKMVIRSISNSDEKTCSLGTHLEIINFGR